MLYGIKFFWYFQFRTSFTAKEELLRAQMSVARANSQLIQNVSSFHNFDWRCVLSRCHCVLPVRIIHVHTTRVSHSKVANIHCATRTSALQSRNAVATHFLDSFPILSGVDSGGTTAQNTLWIIYHNFTCIERASKPVKREFGCTTDGINPTIMVTALLLIAVELVFKIQM
jgi:hypothetical protein